MAKDTVISTISADSGADNGKVPVFNSTTKVFDMTALAGGGDMSASTYDPTSVAGDAFDMDNMAQGTTNKYLSAAELTVVQNTSGTNTGDQDLSGYLTSATAASTYQPLDADLTTWAGITPGTGVGTALAVNVGTAGSFVTNGGALGTPSSGTLTNATGLPLTGLVSDTTTALGVGSLNIGHASDTTLARVSAGVISVEGIQITTLNTTSLSGNQTTTLSNKTRYLLSVSLYESQTLTLPSTYNVGDTIEFVINSASNAGTVTIVLAAGDNFLYVGDGGTTVSTTSDLVQSRNGSFKLVCTVANTTWQVVDICGSGVSFGGTYVSSIGYNVPLSAGNILFNSYADTVTNKRIQSRQSSSASGNITPNISSVDYYIRTALSGTCTIGVPTGTPVNGEELLFRFKDNGTSRTLSWNAIYRAMGVTIPTATTISKTVYVRAIYNSTDTKWDVVQVNQEP